MLPPLFATEHKLTSAFVVCYAEKVPLALGPLSLQSENPLPGCLWIPVASRCLMPVYRLSGSFQGHRSIPKEHATL
jgi:hypothetical protein